MRDVTNQERAEGEISQLNTELARVNADLMREISERQSVEKRLLHQATHDSLTGLPNRDLLCDRLKQAFAYEARHNKLLALMLLDLDDFKRINDSLGHASGDVLLKDVAMRLQNCMRQYDTVARLGGDEFVILLNDIDDVQDVVRFAEKVRGLFRQPFDILGHSAHVTASIGVALYPLHGTSPPSLLKMADVAMYRAKKEGKNSFHFYSETMMLAEDARALLVDKLRVSMEKKEFLPHYQPRLDIFTGKISGVEALLRWHPECGTLTFPAEFFPGLEESGLVVQVGEWLVNEVCRQSKVWGETGLTPLPVAMNVSTRQFHHDDIAVKVAAALAASQLDPRLFEIEIDEKTLMLDVAESLKKLRKLKDLGVGIAIDSFGAGYVSLTCLNRLPVDSLKIDRVLIDGITSDPNDAVVVAAVIAMGHTLGKKIVAKGVQSEEQYRYLVRHGCDEMQGYHFAIPLSATDFEAFARDRESSGSHLQPLERVENQGAFFAN